MTAKVLAEVFERSDGTWGWRAKAANHQIVASDAGQGYENHADAEEMMARVLGGEFAVSGPVAPDPGMEEMTRVIQLALADALASPVPDLEMASRYIAGRVLTVFWPKTS